MRRPALTRLSPFVLACLLALASPVRADETPPTFQVDPAWPKTLPNDWIMGQAAGVAVDAQDHVWVIQRPRTLTDDEKAASPRSAAHEMLQSPRPPSSNFRPGRQFVAELGWGWPRLRLAGERARHPGRRARASCGSRATATNDGQLLKFDEGRHSSSCRSASPARRQIVCDTSRLGKPANVDFDAAASEVYVADGYYNHRVSSCSTATPARSSACGAPMASYRPTTNSAAYDPKAAPQQAVREPGSLREGSPMTGWSIVCDRTNDRVQVFHKDGSFVKEFFVETKTRGRTDPSGSWRSGPNAEGRASSSTPMGPTTRCARSEPRHRRNPRRGSAATGGWPAISIGCTTSPSTRTGNVFTAEVDTGKRAQKFLLSGDSVVRKRVP